MARISGVDIANNKRVEIALTYIYGIGRTGASAIAKECGIETSVRVKDLSEEEIRKLIELIDDKYTVEGDLRKETAMNIKRLKDIGSYRGLRHRKSMPVRGQRTKTNARTRKGRKRTVGLGRKALVK